MGAAARQPAALFAVLGCSAAIVLLCVGAPALLRRRSPSAAAPPPPDAGSRAGGAAAAPPPPDAGPRAGGEACAGSELGLLVQGRAPECLRACPSLCPLAIPAIAAALEDGGARRALCAHRAALECAAASEACAPALALAPARAAPALGSPSELEALCSGTDGGAAARSQQQGEASAAALAEEALARRGGGADRSAEPAGATVPLERSLEQKEEYELCFDAPEGQMCVPSDDSAYSHSVVYCTDRKYKLWGPRNCSLLMGPESRCEATGLGLQVGECDNPFCRNGGAIRGDGLYCLNSKVVRCTGDNAPTIVDACDNRKEYLFEDCYSVQRRYCQQYTATDIRCTGAHEYLEGSGCYDGRRRRSS